MLTSSVSREMQIKIIKKYNIIPIITDIVIERKRISRRATRIRRNLNSFTLLVGT